MLTLSGSLPSWARLVIFIVLASLSCIGQSISGVIYDPDGAVVPNARVMLMQDYVKQKESRSGASGEFAFPGLQAGVYQLQVKQERLSLFQQTVRLGSESQRVYAVLPLARESESVQIHSTPSPGVRKSDTPVSKNARIGGEIEPAQPLEPLRPAYPASAAARGVQGSVVLYATIQADGAVSDPIALESPDPGLEKEALQAASKLRYRPMKLNGHPVSCQVTIVLDFKLE